MEEKIKKIDDFMTKQGKRILLAIYDKGSICSGELATYLDVRRNSMSNALERLKKAPYDLLAVETRGRQKVYTLTELGRKYVETVLENDEIRKEIPAKSDTVELKNEKQLYQSAMEQLKELEEEDRNWEDKVEYILDVGSNDQCELSGKFNAFLRCLMGLKQMEDNQLYFKALGAIKTSKVQEYVDGIVTRRNSLNVLWEIMEENWENGYKILNTMFELKNFLLEGERVKELYNIAKKEDIWKLIQAIQEVITLAFEKNLSEEEFKKMLVEEGADHNQYLEYLGYRYKQLCLNK